MAFCFSDSLLQANFNIVFLCFSCFILLLFVANKFLLLLISNHHCSVSGLKACNISVGK